MPQPVPAAARIPAGLSGARSERSGYPYQARCCAGSDPCKPRRASPHRRRRAAPGARPRPEARARRHRLVLGGPAAGLVAGSRGGHRGRGARDRERGVAKGSAGVGGSRAHPLRTSRCGLHPDGSHPRGRILRREAQVPLGRLGRPEEVAHFWCIAARRRQRVPDGSVLSHERGLGQLAKGVVIFPLGRTRTFSPVPCLPQAMSVSTSSSSSSETSFV